MACEELLSDDSSFYGDEEVKKSFKLRESTASSDSYWRAHELQPSVVAYRAAEISKKKPSMPQLFNLYEDYKSGRQLSETVDAFLARLPPYSSSILDNGPWIYISNPAFNPRQYTDDLRQFREDGRSRLDSFRQQKTHIEDTNKELSKGGQTKKLNGLRRKLQSQILSDAKKSKVSAGKWMFFPSPQEVDRVWGQIAHATAEGALGHAAKVAANDGTGDTRARLICVYTEDFENKSEVKRVLKQLVRMGLVEDSRGIYYKTDAFTHLEINGGNEWGLKASLYASKDVLKDGWEA